jgi:ankyrin repeat protein
MLKKLSLLLLLSAVFQIKGMCPASENLNSLVERIKRTPIDAAGRNNLHIAAENVGTPGLVYALLDDNPSLIGMINVEDKFGLTPLDIARYVNNRDAINALKSVGAGQNTQEYEN